MSDSPMVDVSVGGVGTLSFALQTRRDIYISEALRRGEEWEPFESLVFRTLASEATLVCDIGANLGWYTVIAAKLGASVIAFEPDPDTFELLLTNIRANGCTGVTAERIALADRLGTGSLSLSIDNQGDQRLVASTLSSDRPVIDVAVGCLDGIVGDRTIDVLKIDTQGSEALILRGAAATLARGVGALFIELWPEGLRDSGTSAHELLELLTPLSGAWFEIDPDERVLFRTTVDELRTRTSSGRYSTSGGGHLDLLYVSDRMVDRISHLVRDRAQSRPLVELLDHPLRRRVELTTGCTDSGSIPKVTGAGSIETYRGQSIQLMHNGVRVVAGGYYGNWMAEIITRLHGHHEPQEELVFHEIIQRLASCTSSESRPSVVELGAFWSYYALWFLDTFPNGTAVLVEPDPDHLAVARVNLGLNDRQAVIIEAASGRSQESVSFTCEGGSTVITAVRTLDEVLAIAGLDRTDVVVCDIQGGEVDLLESSLGTLARTVRFLVLSTHHYTISGRHDTHARCLALVRQCGGHIIAEHTIDESFSGDGLIAASFDPSDRDMTVQLSHSRNGESIFSDFTHATDDLERHAGNLERSLAGAITYIGSLEQHTRLLEASRSEAATYATSLERALEELRQS